MSRKMKILSHINRIRRIRNLDKHFKRELANIKSKSIISIGGLSEKQRKEIADYYGQFGLRVDYSWHEYLYAVTGMLNVKNIPENLYHCDIEPFYTRGSEDFEDKAYMGRLLPNVRMPEIYYKRINGYYFDVRDKVIDEDHVLYGLSLLDEKVIVKPSVSTGGGELLD